MININKLKEETEKNRLSMAEEIALCSRVCYKYKLGTCQVLKHTRRDNCIMITEGEIEILKIPMTEIDKRKVEFSQKTKTLLTFCGSVCEEFQSGAILCGWYPIERL